MATFVLVPAAWCGGWCWAKVAPLLQSAGHTVYAPTPTGLGDRVHLAQPGIDLATHVTDVVNVLNFEDLMDVTLVGWSYGGMIIIGVADRVPDRIAGLVYLDAIVPRAGQSVYDAVEDDGTIRANYQERIETGGTPGFLPFRAAGIEAQIPDDASCAWTLARMVPHPIATFEQPIQLDNPAAARLPRAYIRCTEGRDPAEPDPAFLTRARSDRAWRFCEVAANHLAPISAPRETAEALLNLL